MNEFNIDSLEPLKLKSKKSLLKNQSLEFFKDSKLVSEALAQALCEGDKEAFYDIVVGLLSAVNKEELSRRTKVPIATIRRVAAGENCNIDNMLRILGAIHKELAA